MSKKLNLMAALALCLLFAAPSIDAQSAAKGQVPWQPLWRAGCYTLRDFLVPNGSSEPF
jgi:hypothetical protein